MFISFATATPTPTPTTEQIEEMLKDTTMSGMMEKAVDGLIIDPAKETLVDQVKQLLGWIFDVATPFVEWGAKSIILISIIILYCTHDKRALSAMIKAFFVYILFNLLKGALR